MMRGGHGPIRQLQDLNWGAFDHASHAPQLRSCNYNIQCIVYNNMAITCEGMLKAFHLLIGGRGFAAVHSCWTSINLLHDAGQVQIW